MYPPPPRPLSFLTELKFCWPFLFLPHACRRRPASGQAPRRWSTGLRPSWLSPVPAKTTCKEKVCGWASGKIPQSKKSHKVKKAPLLSLSPVYLTPRNAAAILRTQEGRKSEDKVTHSRAGMLHVASFCVGASRSVREHSPSPLGEQWHTAEPGVSVTCSHY